MTATQPAPFLLDVVKETEAQTEGRARTKVAMDELMQVADAAVDAKTDTRNLSMVAAPSTAWGELPPVNRVHLAAHTPDGAMPLALLDGAHDQMGQRLGIRKDFYQRLLTDHPDTLANLCNDLLHREPAKRLVRMLKPITEADRLNVAQAGATMSVRAFLGATYKPLDHYGLMQTVLPEIEAAGAYVSEYNLDPKRFHLRVVTTAQNTADLIAGVKRDLRRQHPGQHHSGEFIRLGVTIRNSETGHGSMAVEPFGLLVRCVNGIIVLGADGSMRVIHLGGKGDTNGEWADDTRRLDDAAQFLKARDRVRLLLGDGDRQKQIAQAIEDGHTEFELPAEVTPFQFVDGIGSQYNLTEAETDILKEELTLERAYQGEAGQGITPWAVSQGITATARRVGADNFDRKVELEALGWQVLGNEAVELAKIAKNASN